MARTLLPAPTQSVTPRELRFGDRACLPRLPAPKSREDAAPGRWCSASRPRICSLGSAAASGSSDPAEHAGRGSTGSPPQRPPRPPRGVSFRPAPRSLEWPTFHPAEVAHFSTGLDRPGVRVEGASCPARLCGIPDGPPVSAVTFYKPQDPHLPAVTLHEELAGAGFERSYPTLVRELRRLQLRPVCLVCQQRRGRAHGRDRPPRGGRSPVELARVLGRSLGPAGLPAGRGALALRALARGVLRADDLRAPGRRAAWGPHRPGRHATSGAWIGWPPR